MRKIQRSPSTIQPEMEQFRRDSTGVEILLGVINTYRYFKVIHTAISVLRDKAAPGTCQPILHDNKGCSAQPTYHGSGRVATNSFQGSIDQVKWSVPTLPIINLGKAR